MVEGDDGLMILDMDDTEWAEQHSVGPFAPTGS